MKKKRPFKRGIYRNIAAEIDEQAIVDIQQGELLRALSPKRRKFVIEYAKVWNSSEAARRAGYSAKTAASQGSRLLSDAKISRAIAEVQEGIERAGIMTAVEAQMILSRIARQSLANYIDEHGDIDVKSMQEDGIVLNAVQKTEGTMHKGESVKVRMPDQLSAIMDLARLLEWAKPEEGVTVNNHIVVKPPVVPGSEGSE